MIQNLHEINYLPVTSTQSLCLICTLMGTASLPFIWQVYFSLKQTKIKRPSLSLFFPFAMEKNGLKKKLE